MPPVSSGDLTRLRDTQHATTLNLAVYTPATIWSARVNGAQAQGASAIAVDGVTEVRTPQAFYRVWFGTTAGAHDLGTALFRSYSAPTLTVTKHNSALPDNAYVTVLEVVPPESILPVLSDTDVTSENGDIAYGDGNTNYPPLARIGCPPVADLDPETNEAIVKFFALPIAIAAGATIAAHQWDFQDGAVADATIPGSEGTPLLVTFTGAGWRYVSYTATDSNGKTCTRRTPVLVRAATDDGITYQQIELRNVGGDRSAHGWTAMVKVFTTADEAAFPEEAMVILFAHDFYGTEAVSIGGFWKYRENVKLAAYIRRGTVKANVNAGYVEFEIDGLGKFCEGLYAPAFSLEDATTPTDWHQLNGLTNRLAIHHALTWHSTLSIIADPNIALLNYANEFFDFAEGSLQEQLTKLCDDGYVRAIWGSTAQGMLYFQPNPQLQAPADRAGYPTVLTTTAADLRTEIDLNVEPMEKTSQVELGAVDATGNTFFSIAPANRSPRGTAVKQIQETRCDSQDEANALAGNAFALENLSFNAVPLRWRGNYWVFDPFVVESVLVNVAANLNRRGIVWTNQACWTTRASIEYHLGGVLLVDTVVEKDSSGDPGTTEDFGATSTFPTTIPSYPHSAPIAPSWIVPPITPSTPPSRTLTTYDIGDGLVDAVTSGTSIQMLTFVTVRAFSVSRVGLHCPETDGVSFAVTVNGVEKIVASRTGGVWTVNGVTRGSADTILVTLSPIVSIPSGAVYSAILSPTANLTAFQYGLGM